MFFWSRKAKADEWLLLPLGALSVRAGAGAERRRSRGWISGVSRIVRSRINAYDPAPRFFADPTEPPPGTPPGESRQLITVYTPIAKWGYKPLFCWICVYAGALFSIKTVIKINFFIEYVFRDYYSESFYEERSGKQTSVKIHLTKTHSSGVTAHRKRCPVGDGGRSSALRTTNDTQAVKPNGFFVHKKNKRVHLHGRA